MKKVEGYWRQDASNTSSDLPWPKVTLGWDNTSVLEALDKAEKQAKEVAYRGISMSRLTGKPNGCREYELDNWSWPQGFRHYVEHGVKPTDEFIDFITKR